MQIMKPLFAKFRRLISNNWRRVTTLLFSSVFIIIFIVKKDFQRGWWNNDQYFGKMDFSRGRLLSDAPVAVNLDSTNVSHFYDSRTHPLIFIGGHPRSGTTLMRAMLDAHPLVRCGEETRILPYLLAWRKEWSNPEELVRLRQGGIDKHIINSAMAAFMLEMIVKHGHPAQVLCNKDPYLLFDGVYLCELFPKSKWIFMVRDGRAVVHSIIKRKITITGYNANNAMEGLRSWNSAINKMNKVCDSLGPEKCLIVHYETLVLHPKEEMERITEYLNLPWDQAVLHHEMFINKQGDQGIRVSNRERSSDQVIKPINTEALSDWVDSFPKEKIPEVKWAAPMLKTLGYDPEQVPPNYGEADLQVKNNTMELQKNKDYWDFKASQMMKEMKKQV